MLRKFVPITMVVALQFAAGSAAAARSKDTAPPPKAKAAPAEEVEQIESVDVAEASPAETEDWYGEAWPQFDRILDHYTARTSRKHEFSTLISHRNSEGVIRNPLRDLLGFDGGGLKIMLGLRFGLFDFLDVGITRQNGTVEVFDTYEFDARWQILNQTSKKHPVDLALRAGISWFNQPTTNAAGFFAQAIVDRLFANRFLVTAGAIYHSSSSGPNKSDADASSTTALYLAGDLRLLDSLSLAAEVTFALAGYHDTYPTISIGPRIITNRHTFGFVLSNSQYMSTDSLIANTYRIDPRDWVLGFHITREI